ncbi:MAG: AAA family ATPase [Candidatus Thorarchaeota archaeon]
MNQFLLAMCGIPSSGKSTLAEAIRNSSDSEVCVVRTDDWRNHDYYSDWAPEREKQVRTAALSRVREYLREGVSVIHDDTNYYNSMRHDLFEIAVENKCVFAVVHVSTPLTVALEWNRSRSESQVTESMIRRIADRFDRPGGRYLWDCPIAEVDMSHVDIDAEVKMILDILSELEPPRDTQPSTLTPDMAATLDRTTREVVSKFLCDHPQMRGNKGVFLARRAILKRLIDEGSPPDAAEEMLWSELEKLL